jgi:elongation factor P
MASVYPTNEFKKNVKLEIDNIPFSIVDFQHVSPGKGSAFTRTKLKNLLNEIVISEEQIGEQSMFMQDNMAVQDVFYNDRPITVDLPTFVELKVIECAPAFKGDTVTGGTKPAKMETGAMVNVPFHISEGDVLKIDTRECSYVEKAK